MTKQSALESPALKVFDVSNDSLSMQRYRGLSPFLRWSIAGKELLPLAQEMLQSANEHLSDPEWMMNLSLLMQSLSQRELGIALQEQALELSRVYTLASDARVPKVRVLMLMVAGDLASNTPLECLFENGDVELIQYFLTSGEPFAEDVPDHDVCYVALAESDQHRDTLQQLEVLLEDWPRPVLNKPSRIPLTDRMVASEVLQGIEGLHIPMTHRPSRCQLMAIAEGKAVLDGISDELVYPIIVRPEGSHAGLGLAKIDGAMELAEYLLQVDAPEYFIANFVDYCGNDGQFRKFRIAIVGGQPFPVHMGVSSHWMIHYVNAGMYEEAWKRREEADFFARFDHFAKRHANAIRQLNRQIDLDYVCIDCAETQAGELLIFEVDHCMVVHAMDLDSLFPYKPAPIAKVKQAFRKMLLNCCAPKSRLLGSAKFGSSSLSRNQLNFSGGPGVLPETVLQQVSEALIEVPEVGLSVLGISHRSEWFAEIVTGLEQDIRRLLGLSEDYHVLFLQGGATQQFSMVPMTLLRGNSKSADYLHSGYWSGKALPEARREGNINVVWSGADENFVRLPDSEELQLNPDAAYLHYVSNETVEGLQFHELFGLDGVPRVCDMSSDFLSRPIQADQFSILYAHAQKNLGPAGVTVVIVSDEVLDSVTDDLPGFLNYRDQVESHSIYNTPPVFGIYVTHLVVRWLLEDVGGLESMEQINLRKARAIYNRIDGSDGFYAGRAVAASRSMMNVAFNLSTVKLEQEFLEASQAAGFSGLNGHRSIGGLRASIYNAMRLEAVDELIGFMEEFQFAHQGMQRRAG